MAISLEDKEELAQIKRDIKTLEEKITVLDLMTIDICKKYLDKKDFEELLDLVQPGYVSYLLRKAIKGEN
jgi:cell division protein FtsB